MQRLYVPTLGPTDWRRLLADPGSHWVPGRSALESAVAWESARRTDDGIPPRVRALLATHGATVGAELVLGLPELQVDFAGGGHASQVDLWALLRAEDKFVSAAFEAKSGEKLGELVGEWLDGASARSGKPDRLRDIAQRLGFVGEDSRALRYQLLHRAATATKLAHRFRAEVAVLVVHSFGGARDNASWSDFQTFASFMGATAERDRLVPAARACEVPLLLGWLVDTPADDARLRAAV